MARSAALLRLAVPAAAAAALLLLASGHGAGQLTAAVGTTKMKVADTILDSVFFFVKTLVSSIPAATLGLLGYTVYSVSRGRDSMDRKKWGTLLGLLAVSAVLWAVQVRLAAASGSTSPSARTEAMVGPVHSGELVVTKAGDFATLPDPTQPDGQPRDEEWRQNLAKSLTEAIKSGTQQVVILFSRQGCPWCVRQMPVMQRAIQNRAQDILQSGGAVPGAAFVGGGGRGGGLLLAPLRVFILDAGEFPYLAQQFQIQAFPTSMFFGVPGAVPRVAQGYLDDDQLQEVIEDAAVALPEQPEGQGKPPARRRKRRGLFR